jgi:hypothetical protein
VWRLFGRRHCCRAAQRPESTELNLYAPRSNWRDEFILLFPGIFIFAFVSSQTGINEHFRYALPAVPYFFIAIAQIASLIARPFSENEKKVVAIQNGARYLHRVRRNASIFFASGRMTLLSTTLVVTLAAWIVASSLWIYPHSLSYFNESIGGPLNGPKHLLASNVDWGQDLRYVRQLLNARKEQTPLHLFFVGGVQPSRVGIKFSAPRLDISPRQSLESLEKGSYALSVNLLQGYPTYIDNGLGQKQFSGHNTLMMFRTAEPVARAGYSVYVFEVPDR